MARGSLGLRHVPAPTGADRLDGLVRADVPWDGSFDAPLREAAALFAETDLFVPDERLDGIFAVTPDNLPLVGRLDPEAKLWTHYNDIHRPG
ncbi:MAG: hypothetical protein L0G99_16285 [Propionibacteriales bacterium]|nr:hypothetical protein [Propionibacteriales bacterium]